VATTVEPSGPVDGGVLRVAVADVGSLDPLAVNIGSASNLLAADLIFDGLTDVLPGASQASPAIALEWSANADLDVWTFEIDPDRTFADGEPVTVDDVVFSLDRTRRSFALIWQSLTAIESVEAVDDTTVRITLNQPTVGLAELLAAPGAGILSEAQVTADLEGFSSAPVGSGPFGSVETTASGVTLTATSDDVRLAAVELVEAGSADAAWQLQLDGEVDMTVVPEAEPSTAEVVSTPFRALMFFGINVNHPSLRSPAVRRAVVASVDADDVTEAGLGDRAVAAEGVGAGADGCGTMCKQDQESAAALVAALEDDVPTLHVDHRDDPMEKSLADAVVAQLQAAGLEAEARAHGADAYSEFLVSGDHEIFRFGHVGVASVGDAYLPLMFGSESQNNVTGLSSRDLDEALADAATRGAWNELEREIMTDSAPVIPIAQYVSRWAVGERVGDLEIDRDGTFDPTAVWVAEAE
jgi:peptide/nickel transport system substrate-binding protein